MKQHGTRYCSTCHTKLQKRGRTAAGTQRWLCPRCRVSQIRPRQDLARKLLLERFVAWLLGKQAQTELGIADRTWRYQIAWCWAVTPPSPTVAPTHPVIILDGIRVGSLVCLIARTPDHVLTWQWVGWESSNTWGSLLVGIPAPEVVVCDGQKGILKALAMHWPETRIQRCLFHVWQNIRSKLTLHPETTAGQTLLQLARDLWDVQTVDQAVAWEQRLSAWHRRHGTFIQQRTIVANPEPHHRRWWYTHRAVRSAYRQYKELVSNDQLFVYVFDRRVPRTTNFVEGGVNSPLRSQLKLHRGLSQLHQQRLVAWYLYARTKDPKPPRNCL